MKVFDEDDEIRLGSIAILNTDKNENSLGNYFKAKFTFE